MTRMLCAALVTFLSLPVGQWLQAAEPISLRVACWNMEGNGEAEESLLRTQLAEKDGVDIWGLSEVRPERFDAFTAGAAEGESAEFKVVKGTTGGTSVWQSFMTRQPSS